MEIMESNMNKGFTMTYCKVNGKDYDMTTAFSVLGDTLLEDIGGSMGPLYGAFFDGLSEASEDHDVIDKKTFQKMIHTALEAIQDIGNAKRGDKTLLDTLIPAVEAYDAALEAGKDFKEALSELKSAAEAGWEIYRRYGRKKSDVQAVLAKEAVVYWMPVPQAVI